MAQLAGPLPLTADRRPVRSRCPERRTGRAPSRGARPVRGRGYRSATQDRDEAQDLDVEPDQRDDDAEGCEPRVALGQAVAHALLGEVEVEDQERGGQADRE